MKVNRTIELDDNVFQVGDVISFTLSGDEPVQAMAMKQEQDGMIFLLVDCLRDEYRMNAEDTNRGGYDASELKVRMDGEILDRFPAELRERMGPFEGGSLLRLPTEKEIFGENVRGVEEPEYVTQWEPMKLRRNRIAFQGANGPIDLYWLANPSKYSASDFAAAGSYGDATWNYASTYSGVRPAIKIRNLQSEPSCGALQRRKL